MARLTAPNGATVTVADGKVDRLLRRGFTAEQEEKKAPAKVPAKKAATRKRAAKKSD